MIWNIYIHKQNILAREIKVFAVAKNVEVHWPRAPV